MFKIEMVNFSYMVNQKCRRLCGLYNLEWRMLSNEDKNQNS